MKRASKASPNRLGNRGKLGETNGNWKGGGIRICANCGNGYKHYSKARKYCSVACYVATGKRHFNMRRANERRMVLKECAADGCSAFVRRPAHKYCARHNPETNRVKWCCRTCGADIERKTGRKYCLPCRGAGKHLKPPRIQLCAMCSEQTKPTRKYCDTCLKMVYGFRRGIPRKRDANHQQIVDVLIAKGCSVVDLSAVGGGCPDILVGIDGRCLLMEIKNPLTKGKLNELQQEWHKRWRGQVVVVRDEYEAMRVVLELSIETEVARLLRP